MTPEGPKKTNMSSSIARDADQVQKAKAAAKKAEANGPLIEDVEEEEIHPAFIDRKK